jgi:acetyltransferase
MSHYRLSSLLAPRSVALVGASPRPNSLGRAILNNIRAAQFAGQLGVVNPRHPDIGGTPAVKKLADLGFVPDLIVITAPARTVPAIIAEAGELGVAGAVIISSGLGRGVGSYAEAANKIARKHGLRLVGPNCLGVIIPGSCLNASFAAHMPKEGHLALISQSGAIAAGMVDWAAEKSIGFSGLVSIGEQLDVDIADLLDHFALDYKTTAILLYVESINDARKFMSAARAAARVKPVVVVKSGRMAAGAKAAATHTGALAGEDAVYDAAFRRAGMLRVYNLRELFDCAETLGRIAAPRGKRLAIVTNGGGIGVLAVDRLVELGGIPAAISSPTMKRLNAALPATWSGSNPIDLVGDADAERYGEALEALLADPENDAVLVMNVQTAISGSSEIAGTVARIVNENRAARSPAKPVLTVWIGGGDSVSRMFDAASIPNYPTEDDAVRGFMHLVQYREAVAALSEVPPSLPKDFAPDVETALRIVDAAVAEGRRWLDPLEIQQLFEAYQIPLLPVLAAATPDEAVAHAEKLFAQGLTVVVKILSHDISHKSDVGGVVLNLTNADAVRTAAADILQRAKAMAPRARIAGVTVQPMMVRPKARELILGVADDPTFGPVIAFGHGGTGVAVIDDKALSLPPLDLQLAGDLIARTRVYKLLRGYRDVPQAKLDDIALTLVKLSQMVIDLPHLRELDINPLVADEDGVLAIDSRVMVGSSTARFAGPGNARFAVTPYPSQWERHLTVKDGWKIFVRPIRPDDEPMIHQFLTKVTAQDLRLRFFAAMKEFSHTFIARLTQLDYARAMAFVAIDEATDELLGVVRLHSDSMYETGEYAVLLRSDLKGRGLGWTLMQLIIEYGRAEGLKEINGKVLHENTVMLSMCRALGFGVKTCSDDRELCDVTLKLDVPPVSEKV